MLFDKKDALERLFLCPEIRAYIAKSRGWRCGVCLVCIATLFTALPASGAPACPSADFDETNTVKYIHDGDTLHLKDGRKVRLIGINTPEVARRNTAAEAFASEAKSALTALFKNNKSISLIYGEEKFDHYERLLAHGFTADGKNIQLALLAQGYAQTITFPPNSQFSACYLQQEREARCSKKGLWKKNKILQARKLDDTRIGFQLVTGKLKNININKKGIWLNLDNKLTVGIRPDNQLLFDINDVYKMINQKIVVRGWLNKSKQSANAITPYYIRIRHPASIQLASRFSCKQ